MGYFDRLGAILRVGASEVSNANPVPVSDAGGALTVDGTVTANLSATDNAVLDVIAAKDFATQATLASVQTAIAILTGAVSATHMQVDVLTSPGLTDTQLRASMVPVDLGTDGLPALSSATDSIIAMMSAADKAAFDTIAGAVVGGHMQVDVLSGLSAGGTSAVDDADFVQSTTSGTPVMAVYEASPTSVTGGDMGLLGMTATRALRVSIDPDGLPALASQTDSITAVLYGSAVNTDGTDPTSVAEGAAALLRSTPDKRLLVCDFSPRLGSSQHEESSAQTNHEIIAAPGAGLSLYITDIMVSNGATAGTVKFVESTASSPVIKVPAMFLGINGGAVMNFKTPIRITANTNFGLTSATVTTHSVLVNYFIAP